jgi:hypothetical protein
MTLRVARTVKILIESSVYIKLYHWSTTSYARHQVADTLLRELQEATDRLVEVYVGKYGREMLDVLHRGGLGGADGSAVTMKFYVMKDAEVASTLRTISKEVATNLKGSALSCLHVIRDDILEVLDRALYRLQLG